MQKDLRLSHTAGPGLRRIIGAALVGPGIRRAHSGRVGIFWICVSLELDGWVRSGCCLARHNWVPDL